LDSSSAIAAAKGSGSSATRPVHQLASSKLACARTFKSTIKAHLSEDQQRGVDAFGKDFRKKWKEKTECLEGYEMQDCKNGPEDAPTPAMP
jgi:hypothetical protein